MTRSDIQYARFQILPVDLHFPARSLTGKSGTHPCSPVWKWPPFLWQNTDFSAQNDPFFTIKTQTFQSKMNPLFEVKHWLFSRNGPHFFTVKHWTSKLTSFSPNSRRWVPKYPLFLGKCKSWISSNNTPLFTNFWTRMRVVK